MSILKSKFLSSQSGAFLPMFAIGAMVLIPAIGMAVDYSRLLNVKEKLQSAADSAVNAAMTDLRRGKNPQKAAEDFLAANLPDVEFTTSGVMENGKVSFRVESEVETPLLAMIGKPKITVHASTQIPGIIPNKNGGATIVPNEQDIKLMRRQMVDALDKLPPRHRDKQMKRFDNMVSQMSGGISSLSGRSK